MKCNVKLLIPSGVTKRADTHKGNAGGIHPTSRISSLRDEKRKVNVKQSLSVLKRYTMKLYEGVEVWLYHS
jgi:hypothetical protein